MSKKERGTNKPLNACVLSWLEKLSIHFSAAQDEEQIKIFVHALRNNTIYQVESAFERCLNECEFMPKLSDVHKRMPEQRYPRADSGRFILNGPPILDLVREIAREICMEMTGREYDDLDAMIPEEAAIIFNVCAAANRLRYHRMGIDSSKWGLPLEVSGKIESGKPRFIFKTQKLKPIEQQKEELKRRGYLQ